MTTFLFEKIVYGPVHSRRLGVSLGVNISPADGKRCSFNCIYCECGLNEQRPANLNAPSRVEVYNALYMKLSQMKTEGIYPDVITFSGNGEPTLHPEFAGIIEDTLATRNRLCPQTRVAVLSNSTMLHKEVVFQALCKVDDNMMKLDSVFDDRIRQIDNPENKRFSSAELVRQLCRFKGKVIIQTMFLRGERDGIVIDNTGDDEIAAWIDTLKKINPRKVMIYTINRETPVKTLQKISLSELESIAERIRNEGLEVSVSG
ncbi:MAG: radical SAM protein [Tannerella sp.]|jgi:wyosine [tRNA(Phe)-imidazoG37] synthetase (radical SAM superfamily)|nr:radical SAM protein [Tannerella sp.]